MTNCVTARRQPDGFSLIELLIVVGLIAVLAGVSAPVISAGMRQYALISASQQVVSTIRSARAQAVGQNVTLRVRFNHPADGQYQVLDGADAAVGSVQNLLDGTNFGDVSGDLEFNTSGRVTPLAGATPVTIDVSYGIDENTRTITVSASGRVQLP